MDFPYKCFFACSVTATLLLGAPGGQLFAADAPAAANSDALEEIVVTGTSIRGVQAPVGSELVTVSSSDIAATPVINAQELLTKLPMLSNFNNSGARQNPSTNDNTAANPGPIIHGIGISSTPATLTLLNGQRFTGGGSIDIYPDPNVIPLLAIDRVEVVADGASALYGADAVAGVVNFVTRKSMQGVQVSARDGIGEDGYNTYTAGLATGAEWSGGGGIIAYQHSGHDSIRVSERSYLGLSEAVNGLYDGTTVVCSPANVSIGATSYRYANGAYAAGPANHCDNTGSTSLVPTDDHDTVFGHIGQDLNDRISVFAEGYYSVEERKNFTDLATTFTGVNPSNPYYQAMPGTAGTEAQNVSYVSGADFPNQYQWAQTRASHISLGTIVKLFSDWELVVTGNYSDEHDFTRQYGTNAFDLTDAVNGTTTATALNPYGSGTPTDSSVLASLDNNRQYQTTDSWMRDIGVKADGSLMKLPGGDLKLAVGAGYRDEALSQFRANAAPDFGYSYQMGGGSRDIASAYAELYVPLFGKSNAMAGLHELSLALSGRYDHYEAIGGTTNPKIGLAWKPIDSLKVRGSWGTSFNAPNLGDSFSVDKQVFDIVGAPFPPGLACTSAPPFCNILILNGGNSGLQPQTATTWSAGLDFTPEAVPGLVVSTTYFSVDYKDIILQISPSNTVACLTRAPACDPALYPYYNIAPTAADITAAFAQGPLVNPFPPGAPVNAIIDGRRLNLGKTATEGVDFNVDYRYPTNFGSLTGGITGTQTTRNTLAVTPNAPETSQLERFPRLTFRFDLGAQVGAFTANAFYNFTGSYDNIAVNPPQQVSSFKTVDLHFAYDFWKQQQSRRTLQITLDAENAFNARAPDVNAGTGSGNLNYDQYYGSIVGRVIYLGANVRL